MHLPENFRQGFYLVTVSVIALMVLAEISTLFVVNGWVFPRGFDHGSAINGILSDLGIALLITSFLLLMAWLPRQLHGGPGVTLALASALLIFEAILLTGMVGKVLSQEVPAIALAYIGREFLVIGVLPAVLIDVVRRRQQLTS